MSIQVDMWSPVHHIYIKIPIYSKNEHRYPFHNRTIIPMMMDALKGGGDSDKSGKVVRVSDSQFLNYSQSIHYDGLSSFHTFVIPNGTITFYKRSFISVVEGAKAVRFLY